MVLPMAAELCRDLVRLMEIRLLDPLEILLGDDEAVAALRETIRSRARGWADEMLGADETAARFTAIRVVSTLYPGDTPFDPPAEWWATPLGRVVARRVGHPGATHVSYGVAGAMLGVTRQAVHDLVTRGRLDRHPDGGVSVTSIRDRLDALEADR